MNKLILILGLIALSFNLDAGIDKFPPTTIDSASVANAGALMKADYQRVVEVLVFGYTEDVTVGDGAFYWRVPDDLDGHELVWANAQVITAGATGTSDFQVYNVDEAVDMFSTGITIDSGETGSETAATPYVIDTSNDGVSGLDVLRFDVDAVSTTEPQGLIIILQFKEA